MAVCGIGRPSGWRNSAVAADQSASPPTSDACVLDTPPSQHGAGIRAGSSSEASADLVILIALCRLVLSAVDTLLTADAQSPRGDHDALDRPRVQSHDAVRDHSRARDHSGKIVILIAQLALARKVIVTHA